MGDVKKWVMSEEERQAYIQKHPIRPTEKPKGHSFNKIHFRRESIIKNGRKRKTT